MHVSTFLLFLGAAATVFAESTPLIFHRQTGTCSPGQKECGTGCIDTTATCCPDKSGGCPVGKYCTRGSNGKYGCCDNGDTCSGLGGVRTRSNSGPDPTSTRTRTTGQTSLSNSPPPSQSSGAVAGSAQAFMPVELLALGLLFMVR